MLVSYWEQWRTDISSSLIGTSKPFLLTRIGGSDTSAVVDYLVKKRDGISMESHIAQYLPLVQKYNGFYAKKNIEATYFEYLEKLLSLYLSAKSMTVGNFQLLSLLFPTIIGPKWYKEDFENKEGFKFLYELIDRDDKLQKRIYPYTFIESLLYSQDSLFSLFSTILEGLNVLIVSPFSQSIVSNFHNKNNFFPNYRYPEFNLLTLNTPITYYGLSESSYPHANWFETTDSLISQVGNIDFDIALLSCGSYAMPIGSYVCESMGKKAIYVGGILQLYFGIIGRRYLDLNCLNQDHYIFPLERESYLTNLPIDSKAAAEAFGAYF